MGALRGSSRSPLGRPGPYRRLVASLLFLAGLVAAVPAQAQAPKLVSVTGEYSTVTLTYDRTLNSGSGLAASDFTTSVSTIPSKYTDTQPTAPTVSSLTVTGSTVVLTLNKPYPLYAGYTPTMFVKQTSHFSRLQAQGGTQADTSCGQPHIPFPHVSHYKLIGCKWKLNSSGRGVYRSYSGKGMPVLAWGNLAHAIGQGNGITGIQISKNGGRDGETVDITVTFGGTVKVGDGGGADSEISMAHMYWCRDGKARYHSGHNTTSLVYRCEIVNGPHTSLSIQPNSVHDGRNKIKVSGTYRGYSFNDYFADLRHDAVVKETDTTPPTLVESFTDGTGAEIHFTMSENLDLSNLPPASAFTVTVDGSDVTVTAVGRGGTSFLNDTVKITVSPVVQQGQAVVGTYTDPTAGDDVNAIQDIFGNDAASFTTGSVTNISTAMQRVAPTITGSPAVSDSGSDGAWSAGATVEVTLTFSEAVTVDTTGGTPSIGLDLGGTESRSAPYLRGSGTTALVFGYTLTATDGSHTSMLVPIDSLALNGGTIRSQATSADAALEHNGAAKTGSGGGLGGRGEGGTQSQGDPFTARFEGLPGSHDGSSAFTGELHFSEAPEGLSYTTVAGGLLEVTGATVDNARRLTGGSNLAWEVTMTPSQSGDITIALPARACSEANAVCAGTRALARAATATVRGVPFTASFSGVPGEHDGATAFDIRFHLSVEPAGLSYRTVQNGLFDVTGGSIEKVSRLVAGKNNGWTVRILPSGLGDVTVRVNGTTACDTPPPGVCTADGRKLGGGLSVSSAGPAALSVADAEVEEGADASLAFVVTLSKARASTTTVQYATADGSATAGADYTLTSGTLTFGRLETTQTVSVPVLDDSHDEGSETLTLTLSNASDNVRLGEATATGTITNSDPLPLALMARFGRTAAVHIVEHVEERMEAPREPGFRGRFAGRELRRGMERDVALGFLSQFGGAAGVNGPGAGAYGAMAGAPVGGTASLGMPGHAAGTPMAAVAGPMGVGPGHGGAGLMGGPSSPEGGPHGGGLLQMGLGGGDVLTGSAFSLNRETRQGGILSFWSRGARSHFSGRDGALSLGGDVRTTMFGADYAKGPLVTGLSLSHSRGLGEYAGVTGGQVASAVTGLYPWLGYKATDRISVWTVAGYGSGGLLLTPEGGAALESGLSMAMAAAGTRGELVTGGASGFELAFKADALWVGTSIDGVDGPAGRLNATEAAVTRFRTGLEGSRDYTLAGRLLLRPSGEVGLRHDGGDAETGAGMDVGGGLVVSDESTGLTVDVRVRMLVVHQAEGFRERGMALSLSYNPTPATPLGFTARVAPSWGGQAASGAEAMWGRETMAGMAHGGLASGNRLDGEVGYGLPVGSHFVGTPRVGFSTSEYGRDYRVGYGLGVLDGESLNFELGVDAQRRESPMLDGTDNGFLGRATLGW